MRFVRDGSRQCSSYWAHQLAMGLPGRDHTKKSVPRGETWARGGWLGCVSKVLFRPTDGDGGTYGGR